MRIHTGFVGGPMPVFGRGGVGPDTAILGGVLLGELDRAFASVVSIDLVPTNVPCGGCTDSLFEQPGLSG